MDRDNLTVLVAQAQAGEQAAFAQVYAATFNHVYYTARKILQNDEAARDIAQDVYITVWQRLGELREPAAFLGWLRQITAYKCANLLRRKTEVLYSPVDDGEDVGLPDVEADVAQQPQAVLERADVRAAILSIIDGLPDEQRAAVVMFYYQQLSIREIAAATGAAENTVKSRLNYARKQIKRAVEEKEAASGTRLYALPLGFMSGLLAGQAALGMDNVAYTAVYATLQQQMAGAAAGVVQGAQNLMQAGQGVAKSTRFAPRVPQAAPAGQAALAPGAATASAAVASAGKVVAVGLGAKVIAVLSALLVTVGVGVGVAVAVNNAAPGPAATSVPGPESGGPAVSGGAGQGASLGGQDTPPAPGLPASAEALLGLPLSQVQAMLGGGPAPDGLPDLPGGSAAYTAATADPYAATLHYADRAGEGLVDYLCLQRPAAVHGAAADDSEAAVRAALAQGTILVQDTAAGVGTAHYASGAPLVYMDFETAYCAYFEGGLSTLVLTPSFHHFPAREDGRLELGFLLNGYDLGFSAHDTLANTLPWLSLRLGMPLAWDEYYNAGEFHDAREPRRRVQLDGLHTEGYYGSNGGIIGSVQGDFDFDSPEFKGFKWASITADGYTFAGVHVGMPQQEVQTLLGGYFTERHDEYWDRGTMVAYPDGGFLEIYTLTRVPPEAFEGLNNISPDGEPNLTLNVQYHMVDGTPVVRLINASSHYIF